MNKRLTLRRSVVCVLVALGGSALSMPVIASGAGQRTTTRSVPVTAQEGQTTNNQASKKKAKAQKKPETLQAVTVIASRIPGVTDQALVSPQTSVTPLTIQPLTAQNIGLAVSKLPQFANGGTPSSISRTTGAGGTSLDLRGLGGDETLVLLDGRRFIDSGNLNSIPSILVKGVQVVTGGASAAWGSGAVAGVVNFELDNTYTGGDVQLSRGISQRGNGQETKLAFKFGNSFAGQKGHFVIGGTFQNNLGIGDYATTTGFTSPVPIGGGKLESFEHVGLNYIAVGGLITTGVLKNMVFNPNGTLRPFNQGILQAPSSGENVGGDAYFFINNNPLVTPYKHYNILAHATYDVNDNVQAFFQAQFSKFYTDAPFLAASESNININIDNAFLPAAVREEMEKAGETSFLMGRADIDFPDHESLVASDKAQQYTVGLKGTIPNTSWKWNVYGSYGTETNPQVIAHQMNPKNLPLAVDAVTDPATGQPVCAIALTDPATTCVPINLFGEGNVSAAAADYVTSDSSITDHETLEVVSGSLTGSPFTLPAGPVRVTTGADWREESDNETVGLADILGDTSPFVFSPLSGKFNVGEWFGEARIPVLNNLPGIRHLTTDLAARYSKYSTSGTIWSAKAGFNDQIVKGLRFRASWSQDIRAPNIGELFSPQELEINVVTNPFTGSQNFIHQLNGGNPHLAAERAHTITAGFVFTPRSIPGFSSSISYYNINVTNEISAPAVQFIVNDCAKGIAAACDLVTFGPNKSIESVITTDENFAAEKANGADVDFSYVHPTTLFGTSGFFHTRFMTTYTHNLQDTNNGVTTPIVGNFAGGGIPRWMAFGEAGFSSKRFSLFATLRFVGPWEIDPEENIVNNRVSGRYYVDIGGDVALDQSGALKLGLNIDNLTNVVPNAQTTNIYYLSPMPRYYLLTLNVKL